MTTSQSDPGLPGTVTDIVVIGAGPAGLAAAVAAADTGAGVVLIDGEPVAGGQFWRHPAPAPGADDLMKRTDTSSGSRPQQSGAVREAEVAGLHHDLRHYRGLRRRLSGHVTAGLVTHLARHEVWALERVDTTPADDVDAGVPGPRFIVHAVTGAPGARRETSVHARSLVLATGAYDLQLPFPGWDLPGVMTAGGVQSLLKGHAVLAGSRVVVAGTGPFLLSVASGLLRSGATVPGVFELGRPTRWLREVRAAGAAAGKLAEGLGYARDLARHRVRYRTGWTVLSAQGDGQLESVTVAPVDPSGNPVTAGARRIDTDVLAVGWGFVPQLELPAALGCGTCPDPNGLPIVVVDSDQRSTVPGVYAAGEICGVGGAALAVVEGEIAGGAAAAELTDRTGADRLAERAIAPRHVHMLRRRAALRSFADALARVYPVPASWADRLPDDTLVCRCEEVTAGAIRDAATHDGASDARSVKLLARPGMGWCQGRVCGYATECLAARFSGSAPRHRPAERPVAAPVPLGLVAGLDHADQLPAAAGASAAGQ
jgi:thioredoxin reductase